MQSVPKLSLADTLALDQRKRDSDPRMGLRGDLLCGLMRQIVKRRAQQLPKRQSSHRP